MTPCELALDRGVREILHFTTDRGILGALRKDALLSRKRLQDDPDLEFIFQAVWPSKAPEWDDHVSLSITSINRRLYDQAVAHMPERWWAVLAFDPAILDHKGVWFATTNNIFPSCERDQGADGLAALYADPVVGLRGRRFTREGLPHAQPTDRAAEVLYPGQLSLRHLTAVCVSDEDQRHLVLAWCDALGRADVPVEVREDAFL